MIPRLLFALERAEQSGNVAAWLELASTLYEREARPGSMKSAASLRADIRVRAETLRAGYRSRAGRLWAAQALDEILGRLLADELEPGDLSPATFANIEAMKARTLLEAMADPRAAAGAREVDPDAAAAEAELMQFARPDPAAAGVLDDEMRLASMLPIGTLWDAAERAAQLARIEAGFVRAGIKRPAPPAPATLSEVQAALHSNEAILELLVPRLPLHPAGIVWACLVRRDRASVLRVADYRDRAASFIGALAVDGRAPVEFSPLGETIVLARTAIRSGDDAAAQPHLDALAAQVIAPIEAAGWLASIDRLIVVPSAVLHYVPFAALPTSDGQPLGVRTALTLAPSATAWLRMASPPRPPARTLLGMGNPMLPYRPDLPDLPNAEQELERITARLPGVDATIRVRADATEQALEDGAAGASIVHLATHGDFPEETALDMQRVLLAPGPGHDGAVHAEELRRLDLTRARFVALSVCNGGLYRFGPGDEPYGLVPAVLTAGAENVFGTAWPIDDRIGRSFTPRLYAEVVATGPAAALRATLAEFREDGALIREWSAFVNVGPGRPLAGAAPT